MPVVPARSHQNVLPLDLISSNKSFANNICADLREEEQPVH